MVFNTTTAVAGYPVFEQVGDDIDGENVEDKSGYSVSLSSDGSVVAIGAPGNDDAGTYAGHVRIYQNVSGTWTKVGNDIDGEAANDYSGRSVSLSSDGSVVAIGATSNADAGHAAGHVRIYENVSGTWTKVGDDIDGEARLDSSGYSVSLSSDGSVVAIGAPGNDDAGYDAGHVRIYQNVSGTWTKVGDDIDGEDMFDSSGESVSLSSDGSVVAIGATYNNSAGHVRVYQNVSGTWTQVGDDIDGENMDDYSGYSVSLSSDGSFVAIGATGDAGYIAGHVRIYQNVSGTWTKVGDDIDGENVGDNSGYSVSLSSDGSVVAIGAPYNDGAGYAAGHVRVYKLYAPPLAPAPICFPAGTPVLTDQGEIDIDKIDPEKHTINANKIEGITETTSIENYVVMIEKGAFSEHVPCRDTIISANHKIMFNNHMVQAREFLDKSEFNETIYKMEYTGETLYNVLLENKHCVIVVNNLIAETLNPTSVNAWLFRKLKSDISNAERKEAMDAYMQRVFPAPVLSLSSFMIGCK